MAHCNVALQPVAASIATSASVPFRGRGESPVLCPTSDARDAQEVRAITEPHLKPDFPTWWHSSDKRGGSAWNPPRLIVRTENRDGGSTLV
jgi:hypothetical protein